LNCESFFAPLPLCSMERRVFDKAKIDDLVLLNNISEDEILGTLRRRFESDLIYTTIGPVLLSVNPFHDMGRLYPCWLKENSLV
tara:strand:+ start:87 stop:338 length:252 start_codon:yes stop_codon:yes gene_type:complete